MLFGRVKVRVNLRRCNKNIYLILAYVKQEMDRAGKEKKYNELWNRVVKAKTYNEALKIMKKYVKIIDTSNLVRV